MFVNEQEYVQLCWQGGGGLCVFRQCTHTKLRNANKNVSVPTLSPDSEPSGAFVSKQQGIQAENSPLMVQ